MSFFERAMQHYVTDYKSAVTVAAVASSPVPETSGVAR
jgi:hypothetical protein